MEKINKLLLKKSTINEKNKTIKGILIIAGIILGLFFLLLFIGCTSGSSLECTDIECFISNATQCKAITYDEITDIGKISYSIKQDNSGNCILTKEVVELSKNEDPFLKKGIEGKKMECVYSQGKFNGQWITSMIEGLEDCQGELKDAIGQLLLLV